MPTPPFFPLAAVAVVSLAGLVSCEPPLPPPPPRFTPNPPYAPEQVPPIDPNRPYDVSPPPETRPPEPRYQDPPPTPPAVSPGGYPLAQRTNNPDEVLSPYPPFNVIDITGPPRFKSGQLARDPSNQKIFRVP